MVPFEWDPADIDLEGAIKYISNLLDSVEMDVSEAQRRLEAEDSQFNRRVLVRSFVAAVEAQTHGFKETALRAHAKGKVAFPDADIGVLQGKTYELSASGEAHSRPKSYRLAEHFRFAFHAYMQVLGSSVVLDVQTPGWQALRATLKVRNRITHPPSQEGGMVADDELSVLHEAIAWHRSLLHPVIDEMRSSHPGLKGFLRGLRGAAQQADEADKARGG